MLQLHLNNLEVRLRQSRFPDSATGVNIEGSIPLRVESARITATKTDGSTLNDMLFDIASLVDVVRNINPRVHVTLVMPYIPYARQDRRMVKHDAFSLKVFANVLNSLAIDRVMVFDAHSDVSTGLINNVVHVTQDMIIGTAPINAHLGKYDVIVAPDAGALKKIHKVARVLNRPVAILDKERNVETGEILGTKLLSPASEIDGKSCILIDDICDGGATFMAAAAELRHYGAKSVSLWVTHGIFSRGVNHLLNGLIDKIYTTDSYYGDVGAANVNVYGCDGIANARFRPETI